MLSDILDKIKNLFSTGTIEQVNDNDPVQKVRVKLFGKGLRSSLTRIQQYGFTSVPGKDASCIVINLDGKEVVIAVEDFSFRKKEMSEGDVAVYDKRGSFILLKSGGEIDIESENAVNVNTAKAILNADEVHLGGDCTGDPLTGVATGHSLAPSGGGPITENSTKVFAKS